MSRRKRTQWTPAELRSDFGAPSYPTSLYDLLEQYPDEKAAERYFVEQRWPNGVRCPHCDSASVYNCHSKRPRTYWKCRGCSYKFTVTSGTVMDSTKLPLRKWLMAFHEVGGAKKGIPARHLARKLGIGLRPAWHLGHRIRASMAKNDQRFKGVVETDETYIGGRRKHVGKGYRKNKVAVQTIVERTYKDSEGHTIGRPGRVQSIALNQEADKVDGRTVGAKLRTHTDPERTHLMTDDSPIYTKVGEAFKTHETVDHSKEEYARTDPYSGRLITTNTAEGAFANLKRQITGTHHSTSKKHLPRYLEEYDHKYSNRDKSDVEITETAIKNMEAGPVRLFKPKQGSADSLIGYGHDEHLKHGTRRGMHAKRPGRRRSRG